MTGLRAISPDATPEEVAAITAALAVVAARRRAAATTAAARASQALSHWVAAPRLAHRRSGMTRGPWRLSGRLVRRTRA